MVEESLLMLKGEGPYGIGGLDDLGAVSVQPELEEKMSTKKIFWEGSTNLSRRRLPISRTRTSPF